MHPTNADVPSFRFTAKWGTYLVHDVRERANHPRSALSGRLEEKLCPIDAIDHPRMLAVNRRLIATDHSPDIELSFNVDLAEFAPRPQREILAIPPAQLLEGGGMLPDIPLMEQVGVGDVLAVLQPLDNFLDGLYPDTALAFDVMTEIPPGPRAKCSRRHPHRHALPG